MTNNRFKMLLLGAAAAITFSLPVTMNAAGAQQLQPVAPSSSALPADLQQILNNMPRSERSHWDMMSPDDRLQALHVVQFFMKAEKTVKDPVALQRSLSPKAQDVLSKLSPAELAKAMPSIQQGIMQVLNRNSAQIADAPPAQQDLMLLEIMSNVALVQADAKYNYCNAMLDDEASMAYNEDGVKKLAATVHQCPVGPTVDLEATLKYVNHTLACVLGDPAYTRVVAPKEYSDMVSSTAGTKAAFDGGGIGLNLSADPTLKLPPSAKQLEAFGEAVKARQAFIDHPDVDECTGKPQELTAQEHAELQKPMEPPFQLGFGGVIFHVVRGSAADKAGFQDGDVVVRVNGETVTGQESDSVIDKLRGVIGTTVEVTVKRGETEITKKLTRSAVMPDTVWSRDLGDGIYAIVVTSFERNNTAFMIYDEIQKIKGKARGYVFDVRNNPGGLLDEAVEAVSWFVHDGIIMSQRERIPGDPADPQYLKITWSRVGNQVVKETVNEKTGKVLESGALTASETDNQGNTLRSFSEIPYLGGKPTVVLANDHSASAAEIFTGGMSENAGINDKTGNAEPQGATFIGLHTYGKFIGQTVKPGPLKTAIKATTFRYFSPRGEWLGDAWKTKIGLTPTFKVEEPKDAVMYTASDAQLNFSKTYLLDQLKNGSAGVQVKTP